MNLKKVVAILTWQFFIFMLPRSGFGLGFG